MSYLERDTFVEINLNNLRHNIREVKKKTGKTKIIAVVKADAYGHGVLQVSRVFEEEGVDYFGVALLEEAFELRSLGIKKPILVQSSIPYNMIEDAVKDEITISISDIETAKLVSAVSIKLKKEAVAHIKVDTGLHRFGILPENVLDFVQKIKRLPGIYIEGIYTHMASKESTGEEYAKMKIKVF